MVETDLLKAHIQKRLSISNDDLEEFCQSFKVSKVKKGNLLSNRSLLQKNRYYAVQGSFRAYVIGDEGQEHTIQFAIDDWWISDYNSYIFSNLHPCS
jgi:hypothetical protein